VFVGTCVPRVFKEINVFRAHFCTVTTVTKTDSDIFSRFLIVTIFFGFESTQLARRVQPKRTQMQVQ